MTCPRCGHAQRLAGPECERCGVIFARIRAAAPAPELAPAGPPLAWAADAAPEPDGAAIDPSGWRAFAIGAGLAVLTQLLPLLEVLVGYFVVLVHELGHALAGWIFGLPSVPAFDFGYGGGMTAHLERSAALVAGVYAVFGAGLFVFRRNRASLALVAGLAALYTGLLATGFDRAAILALGHGGELLFAGVFLHRALSGRAVALEAERPLYAWLGLHVVFHDLGIAWGLMTSDLQREVYAAAKGGGHAMDFSRLAREFLHVPIEALAAAFFVACLLVPAAALLANLKRARVAALLERLARVE
jgi:hypothetical protein